jgi:hypothetical protein
MHEKSLEQTLAEIQVLTNEIKARMRGPNISYDARDYLAAIEHESRIVYDSFRKVGKKLVKKPDSDSRHEINRYFGDFGIASKNLADSINLFLQSLYYEGTPSLKGSSAKLLSVPLGINGKTPQEIFSDVHDPNPLNPINLIRNRKAHSRGNQIVVWDGDYLFVDIYSLEKKDTINPRIWIEQQAKSYLEMAKSILEAVTEQDSSVLSPRDGIKRKSVILQRLQNWKTRYQKPVQIAATAALISSGVVGGILGTLAYQKLEKNQNHSELVRSSLELENILWQTKDFTHIAKSQLSEVKAEYLQSLDNNSKTNSDSLVEQDKRR